MRTCRPLLATVVAGSVVALLACSSVSSDAGHVDDAGVESPLWSDEFDGASGTRPDAAVWVTEIGNLEQDGWGNHELQYYTDAPANASLDGNGHLLITAEVAPAGADLPCSTVPSCPFTSARLTTEGSVGLEHGRIEVRARMPNGTGLLPAIWMLGDDGETWPAQGEIDIAEVVGGDPTTVHGTAHGPSFFNEGGLGGSFELDAPSGGGFHVFAVDKQPERISWSVDGHEYFVLERADLPDPDDWVFEQEMHLLLNVAVGGDWPGDPDATTPSPATMVVDWVRITGTGTAPDDR